MIDESDVYIPNLQSMSMVASLKLFRLQQQLAGIETESDESSDEWKPVQQLYNPIAKQITKKKLSGYTESTHLTELSNMQPRTSMSSYKPYQETYSMSTSSYESCPNTNHLSLSEEEIEWITTTHDFDKPTQTSPLQLTREEVEWMDGCKNDGSTADTEISEAIDDCVEGRSTVKTWSRQEKSL